jgi:putative ABC transport system substrate-binding protein
MRTVGLVLLGLLLLSVGVSAQHQPPLIGLLAPDEEPRFSEIAYSLRQGLREHGYQDQALRILEARVQRGDTARARAAAREFHAQRVTAMFVVGSVLARLAREAAPGVPIVFVTPGDPVAAGLVASLARPGGAMTAMTFEYPELSGKRLELMREIVPQVRRILVLYDPRDASPRQGLAAARIAAGKLGLMLIEREVRSDADVKQALVALDSTDALLGIPGGATSDFHREMIDAANVRRRPTIFHARTSSTRAALATYGASDATVAQQAARLLDKILKGADAGELPVERPTKITFVVNLNTARALGLTIPQSVLLRADQVIDQ